MAFALVAGARCFGALQEIELAAYDAMLRLRTPAPVDTRIVLIHETEADLRRFGHPMPDEVLARAIEQIESQQPAVVGVDKYRDIAVPPGTQALDTALRKYPNLLWIFTFGANAAVVPPPPALKDTDRVAFNDLVVDSGGIVRRALLSQDDGRTPYPSLALALALRYLQPRGIGIEPEPGSEEALRLGRSRLEPLHPNDGAYNRVDAAGFQILTDYRSMPRPIESHTLSDLLDGKVTGLTNRIVLVGANAESLGDQFYTPIGKRDAVDPRISGVELHAHITSQLVRLALGEARPLVAWGRPAQLWYAALWCALGVLLFRTQRVGLLLTSVVAGAAFIAAFSIWALTTQSIWIPLVPALAGFLLTSALAIAVRAALERRERALVMNLFAKHVSPAVAREIWERKDELLASGGLKPVALTTSILFSDIRGFTPISEKLGPLGLSRWLNVYMRDMSQAIIDQHGLIRQYVGDAIMAVFGAPVARTSRDEIAQDALNAVRAAIAMRETLKRLNAEWAARGEPTAGTRIGVHTGDVITCTIGTADRLEYAIVGDVVNTTARLESYPARPGEALPECRILISAATRELVKDHVPTEAFGELTLKGKTERVFVYRVV